MNFYQSVSANKAVNVQRFLDTYTGAVAAYSLRRLRTGHTGYAVEVRRASNNSTKDIGFDADGNFHVSALEEFCSGTDGYVTVWYDQTSNGYDLTQSDAAKQPKIYDSSSGVITAVYGANKPSIQSVSRDSTMNNSSFSSELKDGYSYYVSGDYIAYNSPFFFVKSPSSNNGRVGFHSNGTGGPTTYHQNVERPNITSTGYANFGQRIAGSYNFLQNVNYDGNTTSNVHIIRGDGYNVFGNADGVEQSSVPALSTTVNSGMNINLFTLNSTDTYRGSGRIHEFILWGQSKLSDQDVLESSISSYYGIGQLNYDLPLDTYTNVTAAYSVRKLRSAYTGYCMEVYNGTTYADIGFNEFNELDVPAIASHCGTSDGFVSKLYDQSGNSYTASQTDSAKMPKIYNGTSQSVIFKNGKPIIEYLPDSGAGEVYASLNLDTSVSINVTTAHFFFVTGRDSGRRGMWKNGYPGPYNLYVAQAGNAGGAGVGELHVNGTFRGVLNKQQFAGAIGAQAVYNSKRTLNGSAQGIGSDQDGMHDTQEIIIFDSAMDDDREAIENNQNAYFNVY